MVARHIAISEALERWAYYEMLDSAEHELYGFHFDRSSNGMAAYPGITKSRSRSLARFEAIERFCILNWWEGRLNGKVRRTSWPEITAVDFAFGAAANAVILFKKSKSGVYSYGHAASNSFERACERAVMELFRHEWAIESWTETNMQLEPDNVFERRAIFFSREEGFSLFEKRLGLSVNIPPPSAEIICDSEIRGPWSSYATVWRFLFRPPSELFTSKDSTYFFW